MSLSPTISIQERAEAPKDSAVPRWREFQDLLDAFAKLTGISLVILGPDWQQVTRQTAPVNRLCMEIIKPTPAGARLCREGDSHWGTLAAAGQRCRVYTCKHGLVDFVAPILVEGRALGYLFGGQVRLAPKPDSAARSSAEQIVCSGELEPLPADWYRAHASELSIDEARYMAALQEIAVLPQDTIEASARILHSIADSISAEIARRISERRWKTGIEEFHRGLRSADPIPGQARETVAILAASAHKSLNADVVRIRTCEMQPITVTHPLSMTDLGATEPWLDEAIRQAGERGITVQDSPAPAGSDSSDPPMAWTVCPVRSRAGTLAVLAVRHPHPSNGTDDQFRNALELVLHSAAAVLGARFSHDDLQRNIGDEIDPAARLRDDANRILEHLHDRIEYRSSSLQALHGAARTLLARAPRSNEEYDHRLLRPVTEDRLITRVVGDKRALILPDTLADGDWEPHPSTSDVLSWACVPILSEGEVIAILTLDHTSAGFYNESSRELLESFGQEIASRVWHVRLWASTQQFISGLELIREVAQLISSRQNTKELLDTVVTLIANRLRCSHCTMFFPRQENGRLMLVPEATHGLHPETIRTRRFRLDEGIAGWVFQHGQSVVLPDAGADERFSPARNPTKGTRSMLVVPLRVGDQTIGVISADQDARGWFSDSDRSLLEALAQNVAMGVQRTLGLKLLQDIGNAIVGTTEVEGLLEQAIRGALEITNTTTGIIFLINADATDVLKEASFPPGFVHPKPRLDMESGLTRTVMRTGRILPIPDIRNHPSVNPALWEHFRSMIVVPLKIESRVIGVFFVNDANRHIFTEVEQSLLETLATQAAIALEKARVTRSRMELHKMLEDVVEHLVIRKQNQAEALEAIGKSIREILGPEVSPTINLYDQKSGSFLECHAWGDLAHHLEVPPRESGTGRYVLATGEPLYLDDVLTPPPGCPTIRKESIDLGIRSFAAIPLKRPDATVGVLFINSQKPIRFDAETRRALEIFASHAGVAIEIARYHETADISAALIKAADLGFVASGIAHDFHQRIENVGVLLEGMRRSYLDACVEERLAKVDEELKQARKTIDMFRVFRRQPDAVKPVDVGALTARLVDMFRSKAVDNGVELKNVTPESGAPSALNEVRVNGSYLETILVNLLRNAFGAVERTPAGRSSKKKSIHVSVNSSDGNALHLTVKDSGPGIPHDAKEKLFLPFYSTGDSANMGLGLYIVQGIVTEIGGRIEVHGCNDWQGATFTVTIPFKPVEGNHV